MHIGGDKNSNRHYMMKSVGLQNTTEEKDLGVWISNDLKAFHVAKAVSKANQTLRLIRRTFTHLDCQLMKQLSVALVRPHLEYGNVVWNSDLKKDMQLLEGVQHWATRMVPGLSKLNYEQRLKLMDLRSLSYRRLRGDVIEVVYKYMNGIYKVNSADILPHHRTPGPATHGHSLKFEKRECKSRIRIQGIESLCGILCLRT